MENCEGPAKTEIPTRANGTLCQSGLARFACVAIAWLPYVALSAAVVSVYGRTLSFEFLSWDDHAHVYNNPVVRQGLTTNSAREAFTSRLTFHWHPVTMLSHMLDVELFGLRAGGHHATNLVLHLSNSMLLFSIFLAMSRRYWASFFVVAIFAVHPLHVENVVWISERKDLLCTFFALLSVAAYLRYAERSRRFWIVLALISYLLSLLSKSMLVTLPFILILLDYWPLQRLRPLNAHGINSNAPCVNMTPTLRTTRKIRLVMEKAPLFALAGIFAMLSFLCHSTAKHNIDLPDVPLSLRLVNATVSYGWYIAKTVWPTRLAAHYVHPYLPGGTPWSAWDIAGALILMAAISLLVLFGVRRRYLTMGWLWFLVTLLPVSGLVQISIQGRANRYMYVPQVGLLIMATWSIRELGDHLPESRRLLWRRLGFCLALGCIFACVLVSSAQIAHWHDSLGFYAYELSLVPSDPYFHTNIAYHLAKLGAYEDAITHCTVALESVPDLPQTHLVLARIYDDLGQHTRARLHEQRARSRAPASSTQ